MLELNSENLKDVLILVDCYFVLTGGRLFQELGPATLSLLGKLSQLVVELKPIAAKHIANTVQSILRCSYQSGQGSAARQAFVTSGLLEAVLKYVLLSENNPDHIVADFAASIGFFAVWDMEFLMSLCDTYGAELPGRLVDCYTRVSREQRRKCFGASFLIRYVFFFFFLRKVSDAITYAKQRKMAAISLISLLATMHPAVLTRAASILVVISSTLAEINGKAEEE